MTASLVGLIDSTAAAPVAFTCGMSLPGSAVIVAGPVSVSVFVCEFQDAAEPEALSHAGRLCTHVSLASSDAVAGGVDDPRSGSQQRERRTNLTCWSALAGSAR